MHAGEADEHVRKIDLAEDAADERHDDVIDERSDDLSEGDAEDDADRHVEHAALKGKLLELPEAAFADLRQGHGIGHTRRKVCHIGRIWRLWMFHEGLLR